MINARKALKKINKTIIYDYIIDLLIYNTYFKKFLLIIIIQYR